MRTGVDRPDEGRPRILWPSAVLVTVAVAWTCVGGVGCIDAQQPWVPWDSADGTDLGDIAVDDADTAPDSDIAEDGTMADGADAPDGETCETRCANGGTCERTEAGALASCDCAGTGYTGETCEEPVCANACMNGGRCTYPDYCDCGESGYEGEACETPVCPSGCVNGECSAPGVCSCQSGWDGKTCETPVCGEGCQHRGRCVGPNDCDCTDTGHGGKFCQFLLCGASLCPDLPGHEVTCNNANHCEYRRVDAEQSWRSDIIWIWVPGATAFIGAPSTTSPPPSPNEQPVRSVTFGRGFFISKFEISTRAYEACEATDSCPSPTSAETDTDWGINRTSNGRAMHPQNGLTWTEARAVCGFIGGRLPSEAEWEYATRGTYAYQRWPWGNAPEPSCGTRANFAPPGIAVGCGTSGTAPISETSRVLGASGTGAFDMAGNVREWVEDCWHHTYLNAPTDGSAWTVGCDADAYVARGGSFISGMQDLTTSARSRASDSVHDVATGARCAMSLP